MLNFPVTELYATPILFWFGPQGIIIWVVAPAFFAVVVYFIGRFFRIPAIKFAAAIPLLAGIIAGVMGCLDLNDPVYTSFYDVSDKRRILHFATLIMPILVGIGLFLHNFINERKVASRL